MGYPGTSEVTVFILTSSSCKEKHPATHQESQHDKGLLNLLGNAIRFHLEALLIGSNLGKGQRPTRPTDLTSERLF